jgi:hypothetical protein
LARVLLLADAALAAVSVGVAVFTKWDPNITHGEWLAFGLVAAVSVILVASAGSVVSGFSEIANSLSTGTGHRQRKPEPTFVLRARPWLFYPGVIANYVALAVLVELTGGFGKSPFITVFVALVLTAQQLARFRTQAAWTIGVGIVLTAGMLAYEQKFGAHDAGHIPERLDTLFVVLSLLIGGGITLLDKGQNYMERKYKHAPTCAHVYRDGAGLWHYALYRDNHRRDPVLIGGGEDAAKAAEKQLGETMRQMASAAGWAVPVCTTERPSGNDFIVDFKFVASGDAAVTEDAATTSNPSAATASPAPGGVQ